MEKVVELQAMGTLDCEVGMGGVTKEGLDLEGERWSGRCVDGAVMAQEEMIGEHGIGCEQEMAGRNGSKMVGAFEQGRSSQSATGRTIADQEAGHIALDKALIEVGEEMAEAFVGPALLR